VIQPSARLPENATATMTAPPWPTLLTPGEVRDALRLRGREDQVLRRLERQGLRVLKVCGRLRVRPEDLAEFLDDLAQGQGAGKAADR
jgi:hypothetical protein